MSIKNASIHKEQKTRVEYTDVKKSFTMLTNANKRKIILYIGKFSYKKLFALPITSCILYKYKSYTVFFFIEITR